MGTRTETKGTIMKKVASLMAALGAMALFGAQPNQVTVKNGDTLKDTYTDTTLIIPAGAGQGTLLCRMTFDDKSNPLKVEGAADAVVRKGQTEKVAGLGEVKWLNEGGDGAVAIPKNYHIALPIPDVLTKAPGRAWTMVMKFKIDTLSDYGVLLNMPASNTDGCLLYVNQNDARLAVKQHDKRPGCAFYGESGFVAGKIHTLKMCFDTNKTTAFLDGRQIFTRDCTLAGSHADCAKAGGAFLIRGDDDGEGGTVTFYEVSVYEGAGEAIAYIPGNYLVVDLSGGPNASSYPVSKLDGMPSGGWSDVYKTTKLVLREIPAGRFTMGSPKDEAGRAEKEVQREVTLTKPFYLGVFEVTQKQYELVMGEKPSWSRGDTRPVEHMHPSKMRGDWKKYDWPANRSVDPDSFIGRLRAKTGIDAFDLPTDAQWEYACRAGTATALYSGKNITGTDTCPNVAEVARYRNNIEKGEGGCKDRHTVVGTYAPNAWGLYDMLGNVWEYCLDWYVDIAPGSVTDPEGPESGPARVTRGGSWYDIARWCRAAARNCDTRYDGWDNFGFRIACTGSVSAKTATPDETSASLPGGLVAHWPLDGNANDASGNGNHGKVEGATLTADRNGKANAAYHFDGGKRDTIRVPSSPSLKSVTAASTVAAWIKPESWDGSWLAILSKGDNVRQYGLVGTHPNRLDLNDQVDVYAAAPESLKLGAWQHVAVTYDGSKVVAYLNGKPGEAKSVSGRFTPNEQDLFFGRDYQGARENYSGDIDDMRIYNRALSASEVAALAGTWSGGTLGATSAPLPGMALCRMTFDDSANPLKTEGVADAFVRKGRKGTTERVSGMGDIKWLNEGGDGAVAIPKDWHIALPVPDALTKSPGLPWTMVMKFKLSALDDWQPLLNMPADNATDSLVYVNKVDSRLAIKQHNKAGGTAVYGESGFVVGKIHTLQVSFGANKTTAFLDGRQIFTRDCTLADSYADCAKAGGYFLIHGDEDGEGGTVTFYEVSVHEGEAGSVTPGTGSGGTQVTTSPTTGGGSDVHDVGPEPTGPDAGPTLSVPTIGPHKITCFLWRYVKNGGKNLGWDLPLAKYRRKAVTTGLEAIYATHNTKEFLSQTQLRLDAKMIVPPELAGTWTFSLAYDDYMYVVLDGKCCASNLTYTSVAKGSVNLAAGEHDLAIVCGDTWGGYGTATCGQESAILVSVNDRVPVPLSHLFVTSKSSRDNVSGTVWRYAANNGKRGDCNEEIGHYRTVGGTPGLDAIYAAHNKKEFLSRNQLRLDGWFDVTKATSGKWEFTVAYDDYMSFGLDGVWLVHNPTFTEKRKAHISDLKPGRYWFTVVCGDTWGGYGVPTCGQPSAIMVSINGATAVPFEDIVKESTAKGWNGEKGTGKTETGSGGTPGATSPTTGGGTATPTTSQPGSASQPGRWRNMTIRIPGGEQMMFVWCPPGTYMMGRPENSPCKEYTSDVYPQIKVTLTKGFWLGQYEVTQAQWKSVMGTNPSAPEAIGDDLPVNNVSWTDAMAFAEKIGYGARLPTEAEWEYSCKAAKDRLFHWGETCNGTEANCKGTVPYGTNQPGPNIGHVVKVGSYQPNAWGFYDMAGNVSEWCSDLHTSYTSPHPAELTDPKGATSSFFEYRTIRGGCFRWEAIGCRSVMRDSLSPDTKDASVGFRLALAEDADKWKSPYNPNGDPKETGNDPQGTGSGGTQGTTDSTEDGGGETRKPGCYYPGSDPGTLLQKPGDSANPATGGSSANPATGGGSVNPDTGGGSANPATGGGSANPATGGSSGSKPTSQAASGKTKTITLPGGEKMQMVWCSPGTYMMGPAPGDASKNVMEHPIKTTLTKGFWIGKYEVTQKQYSSVTGANPSDPQFHGDDIPVGNITWLLADEFCKKVGNGARLPTAAEWEYACRAGTTTAYPWGNACNGKEANCNGDIPCGTREAGPYLDKPVKGGSYQPNAWGIYDMIGNMMEWCSDWETSYGSSVTELVDPMGSSKPSGGRVVKGGSYFNDPGSCQSGYYTFYEPDLFVPEFGLRMAMDGNPDDGQDSGEWNATENGGVQGTESGQPETGNGEPETESGEPEPESGEQDTEDGGQDSDFEFDPPGDDSDGSDKDTPKVGGLDETEPSGGTKPEEEEPPPDEEVETVFGEVFEIELPEETLEPVSAISSDVPVERIDGYWKRIGVRAFCMVQPVNNGSSTLKLRGISKSVTTTSLSASREVPTGQEFRNGRKDLVYTKGWIRGSVKWAEPPIRVDDAWLKDDTYLPRKLRLPYEVKAHNAIEHTQSWYIDEWGYWGCGLGLGIDTFHRPKDYDFSDITDKKNFEKRHHYTGESIFSYCGNNWGGNGVKLSEIDGEEDYSTSDELEDYWRSSGRESEHYIIGIYSHVDLVYYAVFYIYEYHRTDEPEEEEAPKGGYWHLVSNNVERVEKSKLDNYRTAYARATEKEHMVREEYFKTKTDRSVSPPKTEKVKAAQFEFTSQCSRPPEIGRPGEKFTMRVKYSGVKNDILAEVDENLVNYETYMTFRQYGPMRKFSLEGDCYDESKLGAANRQKGLVAGVSTYPSKGLWAVPDSKMRLNLRDNTVWSVFPEGPEQADPGRWLEVSYWDQPAPGYGVFDIAKTTWYYEWVPEGAEPTEEPEAEPPEEEEEEEEEGEAMIKFTQENLSLPACKDKFVLGSKDEKKNKIAGKEEHRLPFVVLNTPTNLECKVTASLKRIGAAGENGKYLKADDITNAIPYAVEVVKDKELGQFGVYEAVVKEVGDYELAAGNVEGILLKVEAECGKKGDKDYVKVYETLPIYRIHLGLSLMLEANTIPCYWELSEKSKYKLDKQGIAGDPELDPNDEYVIRQEDFEVPMRDGSLLLMLYDEERGFVRIPAVPTNVCVTATKVENARYCKTGDADMDHQAMVDALAIDAFSTGQKRDNRAHIIKFSPTKAVLDPPIRILADLSVDTVVGGKTYTAKKSVLLHSQPLRIIETIEDEEKYLAHDTHIRKQLERIMFKIEGTCLSRLFSLRNMIERMIDGYDYRFGFDEGQVKTVMKMYVDFIEGRFEGANGTPYKVTLGDDLKACYAFMEGLRDNTGFLGRMALGIISGGISEHVFTTMTILEKMQQEIYTCDDVNKFGFMAAFKIGAEELGKQVAMELVMQGAIQGVAKASNIDMAATMQMWSGRYRSAMDSVDGALKRNLSLYRAGDKALQGCKNFLGSSTRTAANAIESTAKSEKSAAARAEDLLKKSRQDLSPAELAEVAKYEKAMENGMNKVRKLQAAQQAMEEAAKGGSPAALKQAKIKYREAADVVWTDKCALKKLQDVKHPYADRMRAQFNNYRENLLDSVQREALGDIANELGCSRKDLYVMNASNGSKSAYLKGKKVPGDRDISYMQKVYSDRTKDLTIDQSLGQRAVARRLWKKMHKGAEPPSIEEAYAFMKSKDVTYVNPNGDASSYVFEHNLDGYEDLPGMVGMTKDGKINKNLLANDLHNPTINAASVKHKGMEWWGDTVKGKYKQAEALEKLAAKYKGSAKQKLIDQAMDLRYQAVGDACEGIRQITKQTDNIIIPRGLQRCGANPLPPHLQELQALGKRVGMDVSPTEFTKALQKHGLTLDTWADAVSKYVNVKAVPVNTNIDINLTGGKKLFEDAINRAKDKDKNKK